MAVNSPGVCTVLLVSPIRFHRDGLSEFLGRQPDLCLLAAVAELPAVLGELATADIVLVDATTGSVDALRAITAHCPEARPVVLGIDESEMEVLAFAEAGIAGYVARESSLSELADVVRAVGRGEFCCPPRITAGLVRRLTTLARGGTPAPRTARLTDREREIIALVDTGLSNMEIADRLCIQSSTVKNHVHNVLEKLGARRRGEAAAILRAAHPASRYELAGGISNIPGASRRGSADDAR